MKPGPVQMTDFKRRDGDHGAGRRRAWLRFAGVAVLLAAIVLAVVGWYWSREPALDRASTTSSTVTGLAITDAAIHVAYTLLDKPGGYLSNDVTPPGVLLDNMPNWEFGALVQLRDLARVLRNDFSRSQTQSIEDPDLALAEPRFNVDSESWLFPAAESEYRQGIEFLIRYRSRLLDQNPADGNFFARADNLREWLAVVEKRLGNLSQRLSASLGQRRAGLGLSQDPAAAAAKQEPAEVDVRTSWLEIDDVFYEARGTAWALVQFLRAAEQDFAGVLADKNANRTLEQVIRELEDALAPMRSPIVLNGDRYGIFANHSLVMAGYLSRANAAVINLRELLTRG
ncbi:MAG TPA: DUF2333 family protein [Steroidobacteraceae bacterium]|nr:DUF2333 family protein [Steroidobacteraceae bacterium]